MRNEPTTISDVFGRKYYIALTGQTKSHQLSKKVLVWCEDDAYSFLRAFDLSRNVWKKLLFMLDNGLPPSWPESETDVRKRLAGHLCRARIELYGLQSPHKTCVRNSRGEVYVIVAGGRARNSFGDYTPCLFPSDWDIKEFVYQLNKDDYFWENLLKNNSIETPRAVSSRATERVCEAIENGELCVYKETYNRAFTTENHIEEDAVVKTLTLGPHVGQTPRITKTFKFLFSC